MKRTGMILLMVSISVVFLFSSCDFSNLGNGGEDETVPPDTYEWDAATDTKSCFSGVTGALKWYEEYGYDDQDQCVVVRRYSAYDALLKATTYTWEEGNVISRATFELSLTSLEFLYYDENDNVVLKANYTDEDTLSSIYTWEYDANGNLLQAEQYDGDEVFSWAWTYEYDSAVEDAALLAANKYDDTGARTIHLDYTYNGDELVRKTGFGDTSSSDSPASSYGGISTRAGGSSTEDRTNVEDLWGEGKTGAVRPDEPVLTTPVFVDGSLEYAWTTAWKGYEYDIPGDEIGVVSASGKVTLNSDYMPTYIQTEVAGIEDFEGAIEIDLSYVDTYYPDVKTISYNGEEALTLDFDYDDGGYPISLKTSGAVMLLPIEYKLAYTDSAAVGYKLPETIEIWTNDVKVQYFTYKYPEGFSPSNALAFIQEVQQIEHYDGDDELIETFEFTYDAEAMTLTLDVIDPADDSSNGKFILYYDDDELLAGIAAYNKDNELLWDYGYTYDELKNRVSEIKFDADMIPEVVEFNNFSFDIESLLGDLERYMPDYYTDFLDDIPEELQDLL